jgi:hypothetical protein
MRSTARFTFAEGGMVPVGEVGVLFRGQDVNLRSLQRQHFGVIQVFLLQRSGLIEVHQAREILLLAAGELQRLRQAQGGRFAQSAPAGHDVGECAGRAVTRLAAELPMGKFRIPVPQILIAFFKQSPKIFILVDERWGWFHDLKFTLYSDIRAFALSDKSLCFCERWP